MATRNRPSSTTEAVPKVIAATETIVPQDARRRRDRIKLLLTSMTEQTSKVVAIMEEAEANEDHLTLGYKSWTAYIAGEYAGLLADLGRVERREVVGALTAAGTPTRAIADVVGVDHSTVVRDQKHVVQHAPPDHDDVDREHDVDRLGHEDHVDRRVIGRDGKSYAVPSRPVVEREMRQTSLPKQYRAAMWELDKAVRRLEKLHDSDRFAANRKTLADHHGLLLELADKVGLFAIQVSDEYADQVYVEMAAERKIGGVR